MSSQESDLASEPTEQRSILKRPKYLLSLAVLGFIVLQVTTFIPPFAHTNPAVTYDVQWDSPETEQIARESCYACHSNETEWPWYSYIAPVSWKVSMDVNEGRDRLNFSTGHGLETREMQHAIESGSMPPGYYFITHPAAKLTDQEKTTLLNGIAATFGQGSGEKGQGKDEDD